MGKVTEWLLGKSAGAAAAGVGKVLEEAGETAVKVRSAITGEASPETEAELRRAALELAAKVDVAINQVNKAEAESPRFFVAGWRPSIGWVCSLTLLLAYPIDLVMRWIVFWAERGPVPGPPNVGELMPVVFGLLGMGILRTVEKSQGTQSLH